MASGEMPRAECVAVLGMLWAVSPSGLLEAGGFGQGSRQECQEEASPKATCTGSAPSQQILGLGVTQASRYLPVTCTLFSSSLLFSF